MNKRSLKLTVAILTATLVSPFTLAATDDNIIVTASRLNPTSAGSGIITVLSAEDINNSSASTLVDILDEQAGIESWSYYGVGGSYANVDLRGFGVTAKQNTLILLDGRRLNDIDMSAVDLSTIPLSNIARVEIIRSGASVLFGDGAVGGAINIITKEPARQGSRGYLKVRSGSLNTTTTEAGISDALGAVSVNASFNSTTADGYRHNNTLDQSNVQADLRLAQDNGEWYAKFGSDTQTIGLPGGRNAGQLNSDPRGATTPDDLAEQQGKFITVGISRFLSDNSELVIDTGMRDKQVHSEYSASAFDQQLKTVSLTPRLKLHHRLAGHRTDTLMGIDYYDSTYSDSYSGGDITQASLAAYINSNTRISEATTLSAGLRQQQIEMDKPGGSSRRSDDEAMVTLGMTHQGSEHITLVANLEHSARFATVNETYGGFLEPQTADQFDLGMQYHNQSGQISATLYYMDVENEIHYDPNAGMFGSNTNLDPTRHAGLELGFSQQLSPALKIKGNYTYTQARFTAGAYKDNDIPMIARDSASLSALWSTPAGLKSIVTANYIGEKFFDNDQSNALPNNIPAAITIDAKIDKQYQDWNLGLGIENLLNEEFYDYGIAGSGWMSAYPHPERTIHVSAGKHF